MKKPRQVTNNSITFADVKVTLNEILDSLRALTEETIQQDESLLERDIHFLMVDIRTYLSNGEHVLTEEDESTLMSFESSLLAIGIYNEDPEVIVRAQDKLHELCDKINENLPKKVSHNKHRTNTGQ